MIVIRLMTMMIMATIMEIMMMMIITMILGVQSRAVTDQVTPPASFSHIGGRTLKKNERMAILIDTGCSKIIVFFRSVWKRPFRNILKIGDRETIDSIACQCSVVCPPRVLSMFQWARLPDRGAHGQVHERWWAHGRRRRWRAPLLHLPRRHGPLLLRLMPVSFADS